MPLEAGTRLGPYEIVELLGRGGMGEVYKARDTRLGRHVAIKVLPDALAADAELRRRFEREARTISRLQHPHICTLHDIGEEPVRLRDARGAAAEPASETPRTVSFLVMEYLEGESLAERLRHGPLPVADLLRFGREIAEAIEAAHRAGVIHRDLKPANVMVTRAGAKVLDFGVAKTLIAGSERSAPADSAAATQLQTLTLAQTVEGKLIGTLPYMAPEQLEGREADARSDLWALGCLLHEMATGERPFRGSTPASLIASIMSAAPEPPSRRRPLAPARLDWVVKRCLEKDPERRWQSARDVSIELEEIAAGAPPAPQPRSTAPQDPSAVGARSEATREGGVPRRRRFALHRAAAPLALVLVLIAVGLWWKPWRAHDAGEDAEALLAAFRGNDYLVAVVPFENLSGDADLDRLIAGIFAEMVAAARAKVGMLILDRETAASREVCAGGEGMEPHWAYAGSVRRAGSEVRVNASLTSCPEGGTRWSQPYVYQNEDPVSLIDDLVRRVLAESGQVMNLDRGPPGSRRWFMSKRTEEATRRALEIAEIGLARDPGDSSLWNSFANLHLQLLNEGWADPPAKSVDALRRGAEAWLAVAPPQDWGGHSSIGFAGLFGGDREEMLRGFERTCQLAPESPAPHAWLGLALANAGRPDEALAELRTAIEMSPNDAALPGWIAYQAWAHFVAGRLEEARATAQRGIDLNTNELFNHRATLFERLASIEALLGRLEEARAALEEAVRLRPALTLDVVAWRFAAADPEPRERYLEGLRLAGLGPAGLEEPP